MSYVKQNNARGNDESASDITEKYDEIERLLKDGHKNDMKMRELDAESNAMQDDDLTFCVRDLADEESTVAVENLSLASFAMQLSR